MNLESLNNKNIFLTGGTGFFGKSILDYFKRHNYRFSLTILTRSPERFLSNYPEFSMLENINWLKGDIRDFSFPEQKADYIIHAATPTLEHLDDCEMRSIILYGTRHVLEYAKICKDARLLFVSSGAVYGVQPPDVDKISEEAPCNPTTIYGIAKLAAEKLCQESEINTVIARCFAFCGPYLERKGHYAIGNFIDNVQRKQAIIVQGDGTSIRSYLYSDDLVEWLLAILLNGRRNDVYNVGSDQAVSIKKLAEMIAEFSDMVQDVKILGKAISGRAPSRYVPCINKIERELGVSVTTSLREMILKTLEKR